MSDDQVLSEEPLLEGQFVFPSSEDEKPFVRLENTKATTTDEDGESRVRMEALSKGGGKNADETTDWYYIRQSYSLIEQ
ncbi:hypothetical protein [Natronorubrum thiooxidans]|uniref:Uncharacterized protein n=1 Tax=Natronorubrum thiooxidans TaxID=308853 RepID=A0A1N7H7Q5_9EURY|nr:hypothetical protein [Natronorubrum thiooxidans]SIS20905.1 hypothetical protein SAMN05421752_13011 [Natronorubrum thiooxidans]